jgi:hypothetical protein
VGGEGTGVGGEGVEGGEWFPFPSIPLLVIARLIVTIGESEEIEEGEDGGVVEGGEEEGLESGPGTESWG